MTTSMDIDFSGDFTNLEVVGRGGFSTVYRAYQPKFDRFVALKVLETGRSDDYVARAERELRALGRHTDHPNIVSVLDTGVLPDGQLFIVMPFYPGGSLTDLVTRKGSLGTDELLRMGVKLCGALATLHKDAIVHGDIKPANVLLNSFGDVLLADFGLAKLGQEDTGYGDTTAVAFTVAYAAPEQISGSGLVRASDVYALAGTLIFMATGHPPYSGSMTEIMQAKLVAERPLIERAIEPELLGALTDSMLTDPSRRPTAEQLGTRLLALQKARGLPPTDMLVLEPRDAGPPPQPAVPPPEPAPPPQPTPAPETAASVPPVPPVMPAPPPQPPPPAYGSTGYGAQAPSPYATEHTVFPPAPATAPQATRSRRSLWSWLRVPLLVIVLPLAWLADRAVDAARWVRSKGTRKAAAPPTTASTSLAHMAADRPTAIDSLGQEPIYEGLARVLNDPGTALPITIGVCGPWGSGKSSLMLQLAARLRDHPDADWTRRWLCVRFDAWRFQGREAVWAGLARSIYQQVQPQLPSRAARIRFRVSLERRRRGWGRFLVAAALSVAGVAAVTYAVVRTWLEAGTWATTAGLAAGLAVGTTFLAQIGVIGTPFERAISKGSVPKRAEEFLGISDQAERDVEALLDALGALPRETSIVLLLDDLDRCQAPLVGETLATISEVFGRREGARVAFVLGVDLDVVSSVVGASLAEVQERMRGLDARRADAMSDQYLEKIFQLTVNVDGQGRLPVERLLFGVDGDPSHSSPESDPSLDQALQRLEGLSPQNPSDVTWMRHEVGLDSVAFEGPKLRRLRSAIRDIRAGLLTVESEDVRLAQLRSIAHLRLTPRAVKRFDNAFRLQLQVANSTPGSLLTYDRSSLLGVSKWVALRMFFPKIARLVDTSPGLLVELEEILSRPDSEAAFIDRVVELVPQLERGAAVELSSLLRESLDDSRITALPLESFATTA